MRWSQAKAVAAEKRELRELMGQLSSRMKELKDRNERVGVQLKELNKIWEDAESKSVDAQEEYASLRTMIYRSSEDYMRELTTHQSEMESIVRTISETPKSHTDLLLLQYGELRKVVSERLDSEIPHREQLIVWREDTILKLRAIADSQLGSSNA